MRRLGIVVGALLAFSTIGCDANTYWSDRGHDFVDMFSVDVAGGAGLGVHGKASIFHTGLGYGQMYHAGLLQNGPGERHSFDMRPEMQADVIVRKSEGVMTGEPNAFKDNPFTKARWLSNAARTKNDKCWFIHVPGMENVEPATKWWDVLDAELGADLAVVGARAGARPGQVFDFILGWFTVDFTGDDKMAGVHGQPMAPKK